MFSQPLLTPTPEPVPSRFVTGMLCHVYRTYSGSDPANVLSLRAEPSTEAEQLFRVPNNDQVLVVPDSDEVEAEGYHWLRVIYVDAEQTSYEGWIARDSYMASGVRNPTIATLVATGEQTLCKSRKII